MIKMIAIAVVVLVGALLAYAATLPDSFRLERSATIQAPPDRVFALVNDFRQWTAWSPWENIDPALKRSYSGAASGVGSAYAWEGNKDVGTGRMEITEAVPGAKLVIRLDFLKPFEAHNTAEFSFARQGETTTVTWAMYGPSPYLAKLMGIVFSMERMVGGQFETGLANLKAAAEKNHGGR
jgi:uncharacterized protein YndB with AHSA1/START domain